MSRRQMATLAALAILVLTYLKFANAFWFVCDDAYISFRYAKNWALGRGVRYNPGPQLPVEGYSNFLWVAIGALVHRLRGDITWWMPVLSIGSGVAFLAAFYDSARKRMALDPTAAWVATLALALSPSVVIWSTGGLATLPAAALLFVAFDRLVLDRRPNAWQYAAAAAVLLAWIRTEGVAWSVVLAVLAAGGRYADKAPRTAYHGILRFLGVVLAAYAVYFAWRLSVYQTWVSNIATAKVDVSADTLARGCRYVMGYWLAAIAPALHLLLLPAAWRWAGWRGLLVGAMAFGVPAYAVVVGGDWMTMGRLLVPGAAFGAMMLGTAVQLAAGRSPQALVVAVVLALGTTAVGTAPLFNRHPVPASIRKPYKVRSNTSLFRSEHDQWRFQKRNAQEWNALGRALAQIEGPEQSLVLGAIGVVGFHTDYYIFDRYGLVSKRVAARETKASARARSPGHDKVVDPEFFLRGEPTYLRFQLLHSKEELRKSLHTARWWGAKQEVREDYAPTLHKVKLRGRTKVLLTLERTEDAQTTWRAYPDAVEALLGGVPEQRPTDELGDLADVEPEAP